jgi:hypothetical protein
MAQTIIRKVQMREWFAQIAVPETDGVDRKRCGLRVRANSQNIDYTF